MAAGHAERLVPMIEEVLAEAGVSVGELDRIVVTNGPGTFTGARIGIAAARALALGQPGISLAAMSSLEAIAHDPAIVPGQGDLLVALDAHRGEVYAQRFCGADRRPVWEPRLLPLEEVLAAMGPDAFTVAGSAARAIAERAATAGVEASVGADTLLPKAQNMLIPASRIACDVPRPLYLRPPDAKPQTGAALARAPEVP
jgi:tRNA threonylcarbamoyladenosine biosynthesis protein TsaB